MADTEAWYIVKQPDGHCEIVAANSIERSPSPDSTPLDAANDSRWGPYTSEQEAIARRVGLIRAGRCQPL